MQQAIPYKSWVPLYTHTNNPLAPAPAPAPAPAAAPLSLSHSCTHNLVDTKEVLKGSKNMVSMIQENAIIVFARRGCCMSHVVKRLLLGLGVNPPICETDEEDEMSVLKELEMLVNKVGSGNDNKILQLPGVFIGGRLFGGLDRLMATHISGELVPTLKEAGALWI